MPKYLFAFVFCLCAGAVNAQKLPNVQEISLRAPADIKIDGKPTEWKDSFQAFNKTNNIFYSLANDDVNVYLAIQITDESAIQKVILGGVTLAFSQSGKKNDKDNMTVSFPHYNAKEGQHFINLTDRAKVIDGAFKGSINKDSLLHSLNDQLNNLCKMIEVTGMKSIADNVMSVYNEDGIRAVAHFDNKFNVTLELAVPLKHLGFTGTTPAKFSYQVKLNGASLNNATIQPSPTGSFLIITVPDHQPYVMPNKPKYATMAYATDFWGEYTLAIK